MAHQEDMVSPARESFEARQWELYRRASPTQKLAVVARLNAGLIGLKQADLRLRQPELSDQERQAIVRRWWLTAAD
jgi:hypothetical protein